jgi:ComEC/Rec2-related protein
MIKAEIALMQEKLIRYLFVVLVIARIFCYLFGEYLPNNCVRLSEGGKPERQYRTDKTRDLLCDVFGFGRDIESDDSRFSVFNVIGGGEGEVIRKNEEEKGGHKEIFNFQPTLSAGTLLGDIRVNIKESVSDLRLNLFEVFSRFLVFPYDRVLAGVVLGIKSGLPADLQQIFLQTGTVHLLVASGANVMVFLSIVYGLMGKWRRDLPGVSLMISLVVTILVVELMGGEVPVRRGAIMVFLAQAGRILGRVVSPGRLLGVAGGTMLIFEPGLLFEVSWQLSMAATGGVLIAANFQFPIFPDSSSRGLSSFARSNFQKKKQTLVWNELGIRESIGAGLMTWPVIWWNFGRASLLGLLVNPLVIWLIEPVMALGLVLGVLGGLRLDFLAWPVAWITEGMLKVFMEIVKGFQ